MPHMLARVAASAAAWTTSVCAATRASASILALRSAAAFLRSFSFSLCRAFFSACTYVSRYSDWHRLQGSNLGRTRVPEQTCCKNTLNLKGTKPGSQSTYSSKQKERCGQSHPGEVNCHQKAECSRHEQQSCTTLEPHLLGLLLQFHLFCEGTGDPRCSIVPFVWLMCHEPATREADSTERGTS